MAPKRRPGLPNVSFTAPKRKVRSHASTPHVSNFLWPWYGYNAVRTRYFPDPKLDPPCDTM